MTHLYKQTIMAEFGFADPDLGDPLHSIACDYLRTPDGIRDLFELTVAPSDGKKEWRQGEHRHVSWCEPVGNEPICQREFLLSNGCDGTKFFKPVGYLDLLIWFDYRMVWEEQDASGATLRRKEEKATKKLIVEVKSNPCSTDTMLRQVKMYKEYKETQVGGRADDIAGTDFVLATLFDIDDEDHVTLADAGIDVLVLGDRFAPYLAHRLSRQRSDKTYTSRFKNVPRQ